MLAPPNSPVDGNSARSRASSDDERNVFEHGKSNFKRVEERNDALEVTIHELLKKEVDCISKSSPETVCVGLENLMNPASDINSNCEIKAKVVIVSFEDLNQFISLVSQNPQATFIQRIVELDFATLNLESTLATNAITITLPESLKNLKKLIAGNIGWKVTLNFPKEMNDLEVLVIGNIRNVVNFPKCMNRLTSLSIGDVIDNATFQFPAQLNNLKEFHIGFIYVNFNLRDTLVNVRTLTIEGIGIQFTLPEAMDNLVKFEIQTVAYHFTFPQSLRNLQELRIGSSYGDFNMILPNLVPQLKIFKIGIIYSSNTLTFPESFSNLESLIIVDFKGDETPFFKFPSTMQALKHLSINGQGARLMFTNGTKKFIIPKCDETIKGLLGSINERINEPKNYNSGSKASNSNFEKPRKSETCCCQ